MTMGSGERSFMIEQFTRIKSPSFFGGADPVVAENWVRDIEDMLAVLLCIEEKKVPFVVFKLTGEAKCWWSSVRLLEEQRPKLVAVTWSHFRELFFKRYFPATIKKAKAVEFLYLTWGYMTVHQYAVRFIELSQFASYLVPDEEKKARKFKEGQN
ncbi:uncharacterized protein LOC131158731 [Malania oleifera]|uniref:uncharacterized protein LOC131158731 n=1 Tax=Malania oleifera TaxID=397392 RepID=UPI0025AE92F2|nr:uncharacterized protein LOC131158731 [Malania oleifera]